MSQITRCPYCATTFKVVADQLRISDGWVRCGQCKQVFDASEHLLASESPPLLPDLSLSGLDTPSPALAAAESPPAPHTNGEGDALTPLSALLKREAPAEPEAVAPKNIQGYELPSASLDDSGWPQEFDDEAAAEPVAESRAEAGPDVGAADTSVEEPQAAPPEPAAEPPPEPLPQDPDTALVEGVALMLGAIPDVVAAAPAEPGFMKDARRGAYWRKPVVRVALAMAGLFLLLVLGLQIAVQARDTMAARSPAARALMEGLCVPLQCRLQAPQHIASVVIDSSSFLKDREDATAYQLQMGLKNNAAYAVAMPALELTLTDARDQAILRRVLLRADLGAPAELGAGATWSGSLSMRLTQGAEQVAGYRLLAFYP